MASVLDPLATANRIESDYRSYLSTTFAPVDAALRADFSKALLQHGRTRKGPIVQATPPYAPGASTRELVADGTLHTGFADEQVSVIPPDRPLYRHQEQALRKLAAGDNLIVATGTGSGKTECYLLPILHQLLVERDQGTLSQPGVRALLLYPMNALANDQMKRIRRLLAPYPDITFGRYTGETETDPTKAKAKYRQQLRAEPPSGELIDRIAMQRRPPHVLLTNFAMLEYLLLRPADSSIFDGPTGRHWRFIVLDEVHVYDGAKGAEIAMLLRRVRDRVRCSERGALRCIGTSATLGRGVEDSAEVARFAEALFDESFSPASVVHPVRLSLRHASEEWSLSEAGLERLHQRWLDDGNGAELAEAVRRSHRGHESASATLFHLLRDEAHVIEMQRRLETRSHDINELTDVFADFDEPASAVARLIDLCIAARADDISAPLIPARYHLWLRASEGTFVCLHPDHDAESGRLILDRHDTCPSCAERNQRSKMFELAVCRHCRSHYLVGATDEGRFEIAAAFRRDLIHLVPGEIDDRDEDVDEDEEAVSGDSDRSASKQSLCVGCGALDDGRSTCECVQSIRLSVTLTSPGSKSEPLKRCLSCKRHSPSGVVQRFLSGSEAPVAVIATSLYQCLPPATGSRAQTSAGGRKLLMFSDSRQDAAFFAPYLRRTYGRAIERRMVWSRLSSDTEPFLFEDLVQPVRREAERDGLLQEDNGRANNDEVMRWLAAEVLATDRRQSLDGLGLAEIGPRLPARFEPPAALTALGFTDGEALDVVRVLLDTLRQSAAVTLPDVVDVKEDLRFAPRHTTTWVRGTTSEPQVLAWVPGRGQNRRTTYLAKLAAARGLDIDPNDLLRQLWDELTEPTGALSNVLKSHTVPRLGVVFALDHERIEFRSLASGATPYQCDTCRQVWWRSVSNVCPTYRCDGRLLHMDTPDDSHYRSLYSRLDPLALTVEEHTGQLRSTDAADLQERFTRGELNALSCSTTFELGVDVGEVQAVLMRNVPPSPSNYVQRAGRAGRRLGSAALVVVFAQRRSHDRSYYDHPDAMVDGVITAPIVVTDNDAIVRRHVHAVAWAQFERQRVDDGEDAVNSLSQLIDGDENSVADSFMAWLRTRPQVLHDTLARIVPAETAGLIGLESWQWVERLAEQDETGTGGWFLNLVESARTDRGELEQMEAEASEVKNHRRADALQRTLKTLESRRVLDLFAQRGILPKYGFPVDVVDLDVSQSSAGGSLDLNRDLRLGILEFAPGAKVVASNHLWISKGIKQISGRLLPEYEWGICGGCGVLRTQLVVAGMDHDEVFAEPCAHCQSEEFEPNRRGRFVIPMFGFVGDRAVEQPGETRPPREGHLETYFAEFDGPAPSTEIVDLGGTPLPTRASRRGWITVFNRGKSRRGFSYCSRCGYAADEVGRRGRSKAGEPPSHPVPRSSSRECRGTIRWMGLGHRFITNVLELELPLRGLDSPEDAALSALHALIAAAPTIGIAQNDLGGSLAVGQNGKPTIVIFDDVPGGAGHTRFVAAHLEELVTGAITRLAECTCGEDTSCYGCLRSFRNQWGHERLTRRAALEVIQRLVG